MSTTYAMPSPGDQFHAHSHKQQADSKLPFQPLTLNGGYHLHETSVETNNPSPGDSFKGQPSKAVEAFPEMSGDTTKPSHLQLPRPSSFSMPNESRSKSMERRKSAGLPTHLNLEGTGYGYTAAGARKLQMPDAAVVGRGFGATDILSIILFPLPFILASRFFDLGTIPHAPSRETDVASETLPSDVAPKSSFVLACSLSAFTLGLLGFGGKFSQILLRRNEKEGLLAWATLKKLPPNDIARRMAGRVLIVGLPFYATSCLGGVRVVTVILAAIASGIMDTGDVPPNSKAWKHFLGSRRWLLIALLLQASVDVVGLTSGLSLVSVILGYALLGMLVLALPVAYPSTNPQASKLSGQPSARQYAAWQSATSSAIPSTSKLGISPLVCTPEDIDLTLAVTGILAITTLCLSSMTTSSAGATSPDKWAWGLLTSFAAAAAISFADMSAIRKTRGLGFFVGSITSSLSITALSSGIWIACLYQSMLIGVSYAGFVLDLRSMPSASSSVSTYHSHGDHQHTRSHPSELLGASRITAYILPRVQDWPLLHTILKEKDSRRIFYFMCLNFAFMLVQTFYGIVSGSLGLLSDSIHMFFDCLALIVGLSAAVMSKWPPSTRFPYGYAKIETLAGFANGVFLMLISVEIIYEAVERLSEGTNVKRLNELMTVSIMGFLINIVGILAFGHAHHGHDHGHDHSHGDVHGHHEHAQAKHLHDTHDHHRHDHNHEYAHHKHDAHNRDYNHNEQHENIAFNSSPQDDRLEVPSPTPSMYSSVPGTPCEPPYPSQTHSHAHIGHSHGHGHNHAHGHGHDHHHSENMMGIYLHVLGDTLGSLAVVVSTWLVQWNGWSGWDPVASTGIAIIIFGTAIPLVKNCARKLLLTVPEDVEYDLREALAGVSGLRGVIGCTVPKFWIQEGEHREVVGVVHVMADKVTNLNDIKERSIAFLRGAGLNVLVQVEREGTSRCWCQASR